MSTTANSVANFLPALKGTEFARKARNFLSGYSSDKKISANLFFLDSNEHLELPDEYAEAIADMLEILITKRSLAVMPLDTEITTEQAAGILNVSRPFVTKLTDKGEIRCKWVGKHRRLRLEDVLEYKSKQSNERREALAWLAKETEDIDFKHNSK